MARISLIGMAMVSLVIVLMGTAILWIFNRSTERMLDNHLAAYTDILVSHIEVKNNKVILRDEGGVLAQLPRYWQVSAEGKNLYKSGRLNEWIAPRAENERPTRLHIAQANGEQIDALQTTFVFPENKKITLIFGLDAAVAEAYKIQEREALSAPLYRVLLFAGLVVVLLLCMLLAYYALLPIASIKTALHAVRQGKAPRIEGDYPQEIRALTDEINHLLDYTSGSIARHREFSSNLAHSLKTPLTVIANESDIAVIKAKLRGLMDIVDRNLARVHAAGTSHILSATTPILPVLLDIGEGFGKAYGKSVKIDYPAEIYFKGDKADLYEVLGNIIENACKFSRTQVRITHEKNGVVMVEDDGGGIAAAQRQEVLKRGIRLDESKPGSGIGLAVAADIVALYQGDIRLESSDLGGLKVVVLLPTQS